MGTKLILIRHGETDWSAQKKYCGLTDIGLNENGRKQAKLLNRKMRTEKIDSVYSSDLKRANQFARIVFPASAVKKVSGLREISFGIFDGLTHRQILKTHAEIYRTWLNDPVKTLIPHGQSLEAFAKRVRKSMKKILADNPNKTVAVVTHSGPIRIILGEARKLMLKDIWQIRPALGTWCSVFVKAGSGSLSESSN